MVLNLQLYAYTGNSIVDYLKSEGKDSSYDARKEIANSMGITNYKGTASQNTTMLNNLRSGSGSTTKTNTNATNNNNTKKNNNTNAASNKNKGNNTTVDVNFKGVDQSLVDNAYKPFESSEEANQYKTNRDNAANNYINKVNAGFQQSEAVTKAFEWLKGQEEYFKNGKTFWDDKIYGQIDKIENRDKFSYDVDNDPLFQQALASAMGSGKTAMQDTIGQASSLTGGYGSTYATSAGNQAYNAFIEDAYNNLPEYYNMALQAYQAEGEDMYNLLGVYTQMGDNEWNRNVDAYGIVSDSANNQRNWEYGLYQDDITNAYNAMNMYDSFYQQKNNEDLTLWQQEITNAWNGINQQSGDYWNQTELDYKKDRDKVADSQWEKEYKLSLTSNNAKVDDKGEVVMDNTPTYEEPTQKQMQEALDAYNKGGYDEYDKYLDSLPSNIDVEKIEKYIDNHGNRTTVDYVKEGFNNIVSWLKTGKY